jgi:hypothetical protein
MCRSIKVLRKPGQPATPEEVDAAALQFVRKISGFHRPSQMNEEAFQHAVAEIATASQRLLESIVPRAKRATYSADHPGNGSESSS